MKRNGQGDDYLNESKKKQVIDKITQLNAKLRDVLRETLMENSRKNNFIRIYPSKTCDIYDQYFTQPKPLHKMIYKCLYTDEVMPFQQNSIHHLKV